MFKFHVIGGELIAIMPSTDFVAATQKFLMEKSSNTLPISGIETGTTCSAVTFATNRLKKSKQRFYNLTKKSFHFYYNLLQ